MPTVRTRSYVQNRTNQFDAENNGVQRVRVLIPTAEVLALNATPALAVAAPGSGKAIKVIAMSTEIKTYGGAAYATNVTLQALTDTADQAQFQDAIGLTSTAARHVRGVPVTPTGATNKQIIDNKALYIKVATGETVTGSSDVYVYVDYLIEDLTV